MCHMSGTILTGFLVDFDPSHLSAAQLRGKLGFSASHWLFRPIRGQGDVSHVWDCAQWILGKILPHFDPSHLALGQITRKLGFSASHWLYRPIRGLRDVSHVWDHAHWIPGKNLPSEGYNYERSYIHLKKKLKSYQNQIPCFLQRIFGSGSTLNLNISAPN